MNVVIGSAFRNMAGRVDQYFAQVAALKQALIKHPLRVIAVEGDSTDATLAGLARGATEVDVPIDIRIHDHGHPPFASTEAEERMAALTGVSEEIFAGLTDDDDVLIYVESDLIWGPRTMLGLIDILTEEDGVDVVAPLVKAGNAFYDIWAFRKDGERFHSGPEPYHAAATPPLTEVDSAGSCLVMRAETGREVRYARRGALVAWCEAARTLGNRIWVAHDLVIRHPA